MSAGTANSAASVILLILARIDNAHLGKISYIDIELMCTYHLTTNNYVTNSTF